MTPTLTSSQRFLLEWLAKEDVSQLGECKGADLDVLVLHGLASVPHPENDFSGVSLTDEGQRLARIAL